MDEYNSGMDPEVKQYFRKIINSLFLGVLWLIFVLGIGFFFDLGSIGSHIDIFNIVYYFFALISFIFLIRFYIKTWGKKKGLSNE
jgi:hypothetical protein